MAGRLALPDDDGPIGTAALTYQRWRTLTDANTDGAVVDRDEIRKQSGFGSSKDEVLGFGQ